MKLHQMNINYALDKIEFHLKMQRCAFIIKI